MQTMILSRKIRIKPTAEQELLFRNSLGVARFIYNFFLNYQFDNYERYKETGEGSKYIKENEVRKYITHTLKKEKPFLTEVGSNVIKQAVKDADIAFKRWFKGLGDKPKYKSKYADRSGFYVNYESFKRVDGGFRGEKLGAVKTCEPLPKIKGFYSNPRITLDGNKWYISFGYPVEIQKSLLKDNVIGIDLGIKVLAYCSDGTYYNNINKSDEMIRLSKKLRREKRTLSRRFENNVRKKIYNKDGILKRIFYHRPLSECLNYQKQKAKVKLIIQRMNNIRTDYLHKVSREIVDKLPRKIVMESLNVKGMMKNKYLSKSIQEQGWYKFKMFIEYKAKILGIEFLEASRFYASTKTCSCCGNINKLITLNDRVYDCQCCGTSIDRDYNASLNLSYL